MTVGPFALPPPCIYLFPATIPSPRNNPSPASQKLEDVGILKAFQDCFGGFDSEINSVEFKAQHVGAETVRTTTIKRAGAVQQQSTDTAIRRA